MNTTTLDAVCESVRYGYTESATSDPVGPHFLRITDIVPQSIDWESVPFCKIDEDQLAKYKLLKGDIVVARTGATVGYAKLIRETENAVFASYLVRFRVDRNKADPGYVGRVVESTAYKEFIWSRINGAAQPNASAPVLGSFEFRLPSLVEQKQIAAVLTTYEDLIATNQRRIDLLEDAVRRLYREWFVHLRFPGYESVKVVDGVPEGWHISTLGEQISIRKGKNLTKSSVIPGGVPVVAAGLEPMCYHNAANTNGPVITISASGANAGYVRLYHENIWASDCSYIGNDVTDSLYFFYCALKERQSEIYLMQKGAAQPHVYPKDIQAMEMLLPSSKVVALFQDHVASMFALCGTLLKQNDQVSQARDLLLPKLMSGQLDVSGISLSEEMVA